jgi:hypothetical protein
LAGSALGLENLGLKAIEMLRIFPR